jgi:hypothetical protein
VERHKLPAIATRPRLRISGNFAARNVVNGRSRIVAEEWNMWASDPGKALPQWVELDFGKAVRLNAVPRTFDTELGQRNHNTGDAEQCVRDYELSAWNDGHWVRVLKEAGNYQRHRVHRFEAVTTGRLRLTVLATNGDRSARVFEIRAYDEPATVKRKGEKP